MRTWLAVGLSLALGGSALAAPAKGAAGGAKGKAPAKADLAPAIAALNGTGVEEAAAAANQLSTSADPAAHDALLDALAWGLPPAVAVNAIAALGQHPAPPDVPALKRYAGHHNPSVRSAAFAVLAMYPSPEAHQIVIAGLHDATGIVRGAAAAAAAKGHIREAVEPLFQLLARGEEPASRALAAMADADLARKIGDQFGKVPDPALAQCMGLILKRADFGPDDARVEIVRALGKIQDPAALSALGDYVDATPKNPPRQSREEAQKMIEARVGGGAK
ncbi:MAG: HEAT repeat domain-containing protein [Deltaproteobacteria bacterium]|nr:HEAT repeat domain-containing protein [Deltaproteobacteria bacterium]